MLSTAINDSQRIGENKREKIVSLTVVRCIGKPRRVLVNAAVNVEFQGFARKGINGK